MHVTTHLRTTTMLLALTAATACTAQGTEEPTPAAASSQAPLAEDAQPWRDEFSAEQLEQYEKALALFTEYERVSEPIWAAGKLNAHARALLEKYWANSTALYTLDLNDEVGITLSGVPNVLSSVPLEISLEGVPSVSILQCIDPTPYTYRAPAEAKPTTNRNPDGLPYFRRIELRGLGENGEFFIDRTPLEGPKGAFETCAD